MSSMAEEFAKRQAGQRVIAVTSAGERVPGVVVGYTNFYPDEPDWDKVLLQPEDLGRGVYVDNAFLKMYGPGQLNWVTTGIPDRVEAWLLRQLVISATPIPSRNWPDTCECGAPCQKIFSSVDCSSYKCRHYRP